jgi:Na+/phosphate symporter
MAIKTRIALGLAVICLIAGSIIWWGPVHGKLHPAFNVILPLGAIFMGLFLISNLFDKEDKKYGEDQKRAAARVGEHVNIPPADRL